VGAVTLPLEFNTMAHFLNFEVSGEPQPKGSMRAMRMGSKAILIPGGSDLQKQKLRAWERNLYEALDGAQGMITEPVEVWLLFRLSPVSSAPFRSRHAVKPDIDKLARAVLDCLTKTKVWKDDSLVADLVCSARYDESPGVTITVILRGEEEAQEAFEKKMGLR
jgi:Holliday junction resolvase RusA-like endonuclease